MDNDLSPASFGNAANNYNRRGPQINVTGVTGGNVGTVNIAGVVCGGQGHTTWKIGERTISHFQDWNQGMVRTAALDQVLDKLNSGTTWLTIKGNPGEGKTTVGFMALEKLHNEGRQVFEVRSPEEFSDAISTCPRPVIMLDDVSGSLVFDPVRWSNWDPVLRPF